MTINREIAEKLTTELISFPSVTGQPDVQRCAEFINGWFRAAGIQSEIVFCEDVPNVVARMGKDGGKRLLLDGHFDVMPAGDMNEWNTDPFNAVEKDGWLYGRGCADMKSGIAAVMLAMKELKESQTEMNGELVFYGIGDEETGSVHGTLDLLADYDRRFDGAIVPEPTDFCIESAQRGLRWIEFHVKGKACHAGRPHVGKNAIEQASRIITALKNIQYDVSNPLFEKALEKPSLSVNRINGGIRNNIVAEDCTFLIDRRLMPGETVENVMNQIRAAAESVIDEGFSFDMHLVNNGWDPFITDRSDPVVQMLVDAYENVTGHAPVIRGKGGCTDASHISNAGIPVVILGPGCADESHTANEKTNIDRIAMTAEIIKNAAASYLS
jgi:acetylornithine deacetylase/succinyl-diaminopimelate desuccinylase family protein